MDDVTASEFGVAELLNGLNKPVLLREKIRKRESERSFAKGDNEGNGDIKMWHVRCVAGCCSSVNMAGRLRGWSSRMAGRWSRYECCELGEIGVSKCTFIYDLTHLINIIDRLSVSSMKLSQKDRLMYLQYVPGRNK